MPYETKPGQGALFKNDKKGNEKAPDYRGSANINGVTFDIAGWIKKGAKGNYMSLSVKEKQERDNFKSVLPDDEGTPF